MVNKELLKELKQIIKEEYEVKLKPKEVFDIGTTLVGFFELLAEINCEKYEIKEAIKL